jgi:hypothetical protein
MMQTAMKKTINLQSVLCGCETQYLALRKEHKLKILKTKLSGKYIDLRTIQETRDTGYQVMTQFMVCTTYHNTSGIVRCYGGLGMQIG